MLNKRALLKLGWTPGLIEAILGKPDQVEVHKHGFKRWVEHLYAKERVDAGAVDSRFVRALERRRKRSIAADQRLADLPKRYATWKDALPEAVAGMKQLNRYAKHRICSAVQKVEIYQLKNEFVRMLYEQNYSTAAWIHRQELAAQLCRECSGDGELCNHCDGSGVWRPARVIELWCFRFLISGQTYVWHQPISLVEFSPVATVPPQDFEGVAHEKPVTLPKRKFAAVKELIRWVIDASACGDPQQPASPETEALPFEDSWTEMPAYVCAAEQQSLFPVH